MSALPNIPVHVEESSGTLRSSGNMAVRLEVMTLEGGIWYVSTAYYITTNLPRTGLSIYHSSAHVMWTRRRVL